MSTGPRLLLQPVPRVWSPLVWPKPLKYLNVKVELDFKGFLVFIELSGWTLFPSAFFFLIWSAFPLSLSSNHFLLPLFLLRRGRCLVEPFFDVHQCVPPCPLVLLYSGWRNGSRSWCCWVFLGGRGPQLVRPPTVQGTKSCVLAAWSVAGTNTSSNLTRQPHEVIRNVGSSTSCN